MHERPVPGAQVKPLDLLLGWLDKDTEIVSRERILGRTPPKQYRQENLQLMDDSKQMINRRTLALMKPTAYLVNTARGGLVHETDLLEALRSRKIAGAALDVFEREPLPPESELWGMENVLLTPHISGGTPRYMERAVDLFCDNLRRYLASEPLRNVVDPGRGY